MGEIGLLDSVVSWPLTAEELCLLVSQLENLRGPTIFCFLEEVVMPKKIVRISMLLCLAGTASAATVVLPDSTLQSFADLLWNTNTVVVSDIAGDPGTAFTVTLGGDGWTDVAAGVNDSAGLAGGDVWELTVYNPDDYSTFVQPFLQVDGWQWTVYTDGWVSAGETVTFVSPLDPGIALIDRVGIKIGSDAWTGRPSGSTFDVHVVPEPATFLLLGLGAMMLKKRCRR
jgi:hypothetical protein